MIRKLKKNKKLMNSANINSSSRQKWIAYEIETTQINLNRLKIKRSSLT